MIKGIDLLPNSIIPFAKKVVIPYLQEHGKTCEIRPSKMLRLEEGFSSGWCDDDRMVIAAKSGKAKWVFVHEFAHMMQNIEQVDCWVNYEFKNNEPNWNDWADIQKCLDVEWDAENRVNRLCSEHSFFTPTEIARYNLNANLYLHFYQFVFIVGEWKYSGELWKNSQKIKRKLPCFLKDREKFEIIDMNMMTEFNQIL